MLSFPQVFPLIGLYDIERINPALCPPSHLPDYNLKTLIPAIRSPNIIVLLSCIDLEILDIHSHAANERLVKSMPCHAI